MILYLAEENLKIKESMKKKTSIVHNSTTNSFKNSHS